MTVAEEVVIRRPAEAVYGFCRDLTNVARYVGDVDRVEKLSELAYRWHVTPYGLTMTVVVSRELAPRYLRYGTRGSIRGVWELEFFADRPDVTRVRERLHVPLGVPGRLVLALAGKFPGSEVRENLARLKTVLERGVLGI
ncbi:SRPBCC family protein [Actinoplanes sp. CA-142083]|uniref:SRPBCC family protein n=1 Tax=Actinoplanes sp. CA-142083 TaxID=3239903 RepID=UPI003D8A7233